MHGVVFQVCAPATPHATNMGDKLPITPDIVATAGAQLSPTLARDNLAPRGTLRAPWWAPVHGSAAPLRGLPQVARCRPRYLLRQVGPREVKGDGDVSTYLTDHGR